MEKAVTFDDHGRMRFHPEFHANHRKPWTTVDQRYLIENYYVLGPEDCSLALERTIHATMTYADGLRKKGSMVRPDGYKTHRRELRRGL